MRNNTARLFIALDLSSETRNILARIQEDLKAYDADIKWVETHNIHLTLKFLGNVQESKSNDVCAAIATSLQELHPFDIRVTNIRTFPENGEAQIIWAGLDLGTTEILKISKALNQQTATFSTDSRIENVTPHITIGRVRTPRNLAKIMSAVSKSIPHLPILEKIKSVALFKSSLSKRGPEYTKIKEFILYNV